MDKQPSGLQLWILGARPRTLPAAFVPVFVAFGRALSQDVETTKLWWCGFFALIVSVSLQVGVNYANDYSDGIKGTDAKRVGPLRLVGSGLVPAKSVKTAAFIAFGVAAVFVDVSFSGTPEATVPSAAFDTSEPSVPTAGAGCSKESSRTAFISDASLEATVTALGDAESVIAAVTAITSPVQKSCARIPTLTGVKN